MSRVYADVNQQMPRSYWDYDSVNITWGVLENYEVVRKIGMLRGLAALLHVLPRDPDTDMPWSRTGKIFRGF
jgi:hypothetical protein